MAFKSSVSALEFGKVGCSIQGVPLYVRGGWMTKIEGRDCAGNFIFTFDLFFHIVKDEEIINSREKYDGRK